MALNLMYITNRPEVAKIVEDAGVDRVFLDLEYIGKADRQGGMDTVQSRHTLDDIKELSRTLRTSELLVRVNPIHEATKAYCSSKEEIDIAIANGADILMLPYFKTVREVASFIEYTDGRAKTMPLVETPEAAAAIDEILALDGLDEIFVGLNDLSLGFGMKFMFQLLSDGTVEKLCMKFRQKGIPYGFGGIAALGKGALPSEYVIREHYRLGSTRAILSRSFCNTSVITDPDEIRSIFESGMRDIRALEQECELHARYFYDNLQEVIARVNRIVEPADN